MEPLARPSAVAAWGYFRHGGKVVLAHGEVAGLAFDLSVAPSSGVSCAPFAGSPLCAVSASGVLAGLAFDFIMAPSSGVSFDLFAATEL